MCQPLHFQKLAFLTFTLCSQMSKTANQYVCSESFWTIGHDFRLYASTATSSRERNTDMGQITSIRTSAKFKLPGGPTARVMIFTTSRYNSTLARHNHLNDEHCHNGPCRFTTPSTTHDVILQSVHVHIRLS